MIERDEYRDAGLYRTREKERALVLSVYVCVIWGWNNKPYSLKKKNWGRGEKQKKIFSLKVTGDKSRISQVSEHSKVEDKNLVITLPLWCSDLQYD